jgi:hypothetical protein
MGLCVEPTRVVLKMPRMLSDIVHEFLQGQADIEVVAVLDGGEALEDAVTRYSADLVIIAGDQFRIPPAWLNLLDARPRLRLLALASQGHRSALCEVLGDIPPQRLAEAVRSARTTT